MFAGAPDPRSPLRRQVLHRSRRKRCLLSFDLSCAYREGKERSLFSECGRGRGSRLSPLFAVPSREFARNSSVAGNLKHGFTSIAFDRREWTGRGRSRCFSGTIGSWIKAPAALVFETSGRDSDGGGSDTPSTLRQEVDRRNEFANESGCAGLGIRLRSAIQRGHSQRLPSNAHSDSTAGATDRDPTG